MFANNWADATLLCNIGNRIVKEELLGYIEE
jgi:hypothetical protein